MARPIALGLAAVLLVAAPHAAGAGAPTDQLRTQIDRVVKTLEDPELKKESRTKERRGAVRRIADEIFDFAETARRSLGLHWAQRSPAERTEFVQLFADLLERSYLSKVELFNGEKITYVGESIDVEQAMVRTKIMTKQGSEFPIDYRMHRKDNRWLVYDVLIEGVSLIANYRAQFNKIIQTSSYQELVKRMKTKQEEFLENQKLRKS
ncbi:MAG: ABC transporter substrate-binding protein [Candidatus Rokubacteria bacterium]|nr:ABC transporter substrate-binding protein [Candidatus Rokubacteria bacterium]